MKSIRGAILIVLAALCAFSQTDSRSDREKLIGAWRLAAITGPDGTPVTSGAPTGMLIYTRDGHMSVQFMYPKSQKRKGRGARHQTVPGTDRAALRFARVPQKSLSNEYVENEYEASFGSYDINAATHTLTHHVEGSNTRDRLVGKDLPRLYQFNAKGQLIIRPARPDEHWSVTWEHTDMNTNIPRSALTPEDIQKVSPALASYTRNSIEEDLWKRPDLSPRDRGIVTVSALIARNQTIGMLHNFNLALDNGVKPSELSEIVTHLAFYSGWPNALAAVAVAKDIFEQLGIGTQQLAPVSPELLPLNQAAEADRAARVQQDIGHVAPGVVQYTTDLLFRDLWLRPGLAPRDRSLVTVSALVASGQAAQITYHLNRAMDNGLTKAQASEALTHLAFYAGWPNVFSALPVVKAVFERRDPAAREK